MNTSELTAIVMVDKNWGIGKDGDQLIYIPADLKRFKQLTTARPVIYGRKTMNTFPKGRPLPGRRNMILSNALKYVEGAEVFHSIEDLLAAVSDNAFIIGGESVYKQFFPYMDTVMATKVEIDLPADRFFPNLDQDSNWKIYEQSKQLEYNGTQFRYVTYRRV